MSINLMEIASLLLLATLVEGFVEYAFGEVQKMKPYLKYVAMVIGIAVSVAYDVDILAMFGLTTTVAFVPQVISGIVIGRGSNYLNDILGRIRGAKPDAVPEPPQA